MSFASEVKRELANIEVENCCMASELSALISMIGVISKTREKYTLDIQTENAAIARRIYSLIKSVYSYPVELLVRKKMQLKKNNVYIIRLVKNVEHILLELNLLEESVELTYTVGKNIRSEEHTSELQSRG